MLKIWLKWIVICLFIATYGRADRCLSSMVNRDTRANLAYSNEIIIQVSDNVLHQMSSRVFGTLVREILNYQVKYEPIEFSKDAMELTEKEKLFDTLEQIVAPKKPILNLGVWMPADYHMPPPGIEMMGLWENLYSTYIKMRCFFVESKLRSNTIRLTTVITTGRFSMGRFGWFTPKKLIEMDASSPIIPYTVFKDNTAARFNRFLFDESILKEFESEGEYTPDHCRNNRCVTLLSAHQEETHFVIDHINELQLYVKVVWFGDNLRYVAKELYDQNIDKRSNQRKSFIVVHWTPSEIIDVDIEYETISMPKCEQFSSENSKNTMCKYELTPILMYCSKQFREVTGIDKVFSIINFNQTNEKYLLQMYNKLTDIQSETQTSSQIADNVVQIDHIVNGASDKDTIFNQIACKFIREDIKMTDDIGELAREIAKLKKQKVFIGGIYPKKEEQENEHNGVKTAVELAERDIKRNGTILQDIDLKVQYNNDGCHLDTVMRTFINYYVQTNGLLGVLGPPCSETVEPVASLSKHINLPVISYSAEGVSFKDRDKYPYFFRTIGENKQYEHVYVRLLKELKWKRVVAFTEDGQKYTEYISQLENALKENGIELTNKKFSKYFSPDKIKSSLQDLKTKNSNIIIADIYGEHAGVVLCEAYKLEMSAKHGYVWFFPIWVTKGSQEIYASSEVNCTRDEIDEMLEGHLSLAHQSYAVDEEIMETSHTVGEWKESYGLTNTSHYGGYAYDAVWVYALALDKLIKESPNHLATLHSRNTTDRFIKIISETNFNGVSGRIQFGEGGSRLSNIKIMQWFNNENHLVGMFEPNVSDANGTRLIQGGNFNFSASNIQWFTPNGEIPTDGTNVCSVDGLARLLGYDCNQTLLIITALLCSLLVILISAASFIFWKHRYDKKLKASAKLMRNFGIDLLSMSPVHSNTLDKWEISKDRVVINRRLGEGAFGTVYGGEAQIGDQGWTAVAVKTLKKGSNTEDRLDFLSEAEAMKRFDHSNIVQLLGVCLQTEPIYAVMEYMLYGDLKTYLLARRHLVNEKICDDSDISPKRLTMMALDVARALSYLSEMKYVHRDVACRNCLVNAQRVVKLGDFGMARSTSENDYYRFSRKGMLPVRWMAPESLSLGKFTPASDIWSFGVLLFEIITFGSFPFQGMTNNQVLEHVKEGNTLTIPNGIKPQLEGLMKACWNLSYLKRPTASEVAEFIVNYPKLVTASLDVPLASVQIPETESDQLELLPGLRKASITECNEQRELIFSNNLNSNMSDLRIPNGITLTDFNAATDDYISASCPTTPSVAMGYNPIEPLLRYEDQHGDDNASLRRYVPMYGSRKGNRALQLNEHVI